MNGELCVCPVLHGPEKYNPDTIDLVNNLEERKYWCTTLAHMVKSFVNRASSLNPDFKEAKESAQKVYEDFNNLVQQNLDNSNIHSPLSIRTLLEHNEDLLRKHGFTDAWRSQKVLETRTAFKDFKSRINYIDSLTDETERWLSLARGVLGGNMFDWGARAVADILELSKDFRLDDAMAKIEPRPWYMDDFDKWLERISVKKYKQAVIFVDNSGVDFVLGVLPFARELLKRNVKVVLSSNSLPALNDVTHAEMVEYLPEAGRHCEIIKSAIQDNRLVPMANGQRGPCLDLRMLPNDLCRILESTDLIILEGMGRAVHTNLHAEFTIDSLKMAVLKNEWLARSLGATQFGVVFSFAPVS